MKPVILRIGSGLKRTLAAGLCLATLSLAAKAGTLTLPGYDRMDVTAAHRSLPVAASLWYPAGSATYRAPIGDNILFKGRSAFVGAGIAKGKHPLILLSHGSGGNMDGLAWLSSGLALKGAMVLAVNHPGSTSGDSSPRRSVEIANRAKDLSAALDQVLANPFFEPFIDTNRISSMGFSLGGGTVLNLAGLSLDKDAYADYCEVNEGLAQDCVFLAKGGVDFGHLPESFSASAKDPRISATVAIDPGFTYAVDKASLEQATQPVLFINIGEENLWPAADVGPKGSNLAARMENSTRKVAAPGHHFTFLPECKPGAKEILAEEEDDPICDDPEGTDRSAVHEAIIMEIAAFLKL